MSTGVGARRCGEKGGGLATGEEGAHIGSVLKSARMKIGVLGKL